MYSSKTKAQTSRVNSMAVIVVSLVMAGIVLGGLAYGVLYFKATVDHMSTTFEQAGQGISRCFGTTN